jgi:hypothetical protein
MGMTWKMLIIKTTEPICGLEYPRSKRYRVRRNHTVALATAEITDTMTNFFASGENPLNGLKYSAILLTIKWGN